MTGNTNHEHNLASVCICTYNRASCLADTLASLKSAIRTAGLAVEVLIVDNGSTDNTQAVATDFIASNPDITARYSQEPRNGLSYARNLALDMARGGIICFLDDDVVVSEGWLAGIVDAFRLDAGVGAVAGQVLPDWGNSTVPAWLDKRLHGFYGVCTKGDRIVALSPGEVFVGCNFALRKAAVVQVGAFDTVLGRRHNILLSGEDDDYARRILKAGYIIAYAPDGLVHHRIPADRITFRWLLRRYFWQGVTSALRPENRSLLYISHVVPRLLLGILTLPLAVLSASRRPVFRACFRIANSLGPFYGCYLACRDSRGSSSQAAR